MNVELIWDVDDIPECSVIQDVREEGDSYVGLWCSARGSYEVKVPKASCKLHVSNALENVFEAISELGLVEAHEGHIRPASTEDVRCRVLTRWGLGRRTKAPVGAGNYVPGVKAFLVGEQTSHPEKNKHHAPFCSTKACSGWLNKLLCEANIDEKDLFWVNALDNDGTPVDLGSMHAHLKPGKVFALGKVAERQLAVYNVTYTAFAHPQYWKRFKSKQPYPLIDELRRCCL
jgi:hypothetical protein